MTNHERYQAAFSQVHAPAGAVQRALARLETPDRRRSRPRRRLPLRVAVIAAVAAALLIGTASAEIASGEISNLLAPLYGGAQTELVDGIGVPIGASTTVNGYTLTADAVIGDRHSISIVYTLTRDDGEPIPERVLFAQNYNSLTGMSSGSGSLSTERDESLPSNQIKIVEQWTTEANLMFRRNATVVFQDLMVYDGEEETLLAEGVWELKFTVRYQDTTVTAPFNNVTFTDADGGVYTLQQLQISPVGIYIKFIAPTPEWMEPQYYVGKGVQVSLRLSDGSAIELHCGGSGGWTEGDETYKANLEAAFDVPILLEDMEALIICDTEIPLDFS